MIKNFSVPSPCHEKWDKMQPQENGRHCDSCQKVVIDFTKMTDQQIIDHLSANAGKKMCGTFKNSQLPPPPQQQKIHHQDKTLLFLAALLLVFGMTLFSCQSVDFGDKGTCDPLKQEGCTFTTGIMIISPPPLHKDSLKAINRSLYNGNIGPPVDDSVFTEESTTTGEIVIPEPIIKDTVPNSDKLIVGMIFPEQMPEFPEGTDKMIQYISDNIHYPKEALENEISGRVYINFTVKKDGTLDNIKVVRGIGFGCDEEAIRVVKNMPKWKPGIDHGKPVDTKFNLPIKFKLK